MADPKVTLASIGGMTLGLLLAWANGPIAWEWFAWTVLGIWCVEIAKNASGEVFDWDSGCDQRVREEDRSPFSGGKRVLVDGLLSRRGTWLIAGVCYALALLVGLWIAWQREPGILGFALLGVVLAVSYHAPPLRLAYRGLGELAVALTYGPLITAGTYLVLRGEVRPTVWWLSGLLGIAIAAFLLINEVPDHAADATSGKRTLVVRLGRTRACKMVAVTVLTPFALLLLAPLVEVPRAAWLGLVGVIPASAAAARIWTAPRTARVVPAQALTLVAFLCLAVGCGLGVLWVA